MNRRRHEFRPRFRAFAIAAMCFGLALSVGGLLAPEVSRGLDIAFALGFLVFVFGGVYLISPSWRLYVETDEAGITVGARDRIRFSVPWSDVVSVTASPSTKTCFVNGGGPDKSLLVPGVDAPASYDITDKEQLYETILARVPSERVTIVESLLSIHDESFPTARARSAGSPSRHP